MFYTLFVCGNYFFNTVLFQSAFSSYYFGELFFSFCVLRVFCIMGFEFDVIFIQLGKLLQHYMIIVYVSAIWPSAILLSLDKNFLFTKII